MFIANKLGVKNVWFYAILGIGGVWTAFLMSGVHATISAVLSAFMIPADSKIPEAAFISRLKKQLHHFEEAQSNDVITLEKEQVEIITKVKVIKKSNTQARIFDQNYVAIKKIADCNNPEPIKPLIVTYTMQLHY